MGVVTAFTGNPTDRQDLVIVVDVAGGVFRHLLDRELQCERRQRWKRYRHVLLVGEAVRQIRLEVTPVELTVDES